VGLATRAAMSTPNSASSARSRWRGTAGDDLIVTASSGIAWLVSRAAYASPGGPQPTVHTPLCRDPQTLKGPGPCLGHDALGRVQPRSSRGERGARRRRGRTGPPLPVRPVSWSWRSRRCRVRLQQRALARPGAAHLVGPASAFRWWLVTGARQDAGDRAADGHQIRDDLPALRAAPTCVGCRERLGLPSRGRTMRGRSGHHPDRATRSGAPTSVNSSRASRRQAAAASAPSAWRSAWPRVTRVRAWPRRCPETRCGATVPRACSMARSCRSRARWAAARMVRAWPYRTR
jgi:hypothetical protein